CESRAPGGSRQACQSGLFCGPRAPRVALPATAAAARSRQPGPVCHCGGTGFTGPSCSEDVDECSIEASATPPCGVGGICINLPGSFRCHVHLGYSGRNCEHFDVPGSRCRSRQRRREAGGILGKRAEQRWSLSPSPEPAPSSLLLALNGLPLRLLLPAPSAEARALRQRRRQWQAAQQQQQLQRRRRQSDDGTDFDGCQQMLGDPSRRWRWSHAGQRGDSHCGRQRELDCVLSPARRTTYACFEKPTPGLAASASAVELSCCSLASNVFSGGGGCCCKPRQLHRRHADSLLDAGVAAAASAAPAPKDAKRLGCRTSTPGWALSLGHLRLARSCWHRRRCATPGNPQQPDLLQDNPFYCVLGGSQQLHHCCQHSRCSSSGLSSPSHLCHHHQHQQQPQVRPRLRCDSPSAAVPAASAAASSVCVVTFAALAGVAAELCQQRLRRRRRRTCRSSPSCQPAAAAAASASWRRTRTSANAAGATDEVDDFEEVDVSQSASEVAARSAGGVMTASTTSTFRGSGGSGTAPRPAAAAPRAARWRLRAPSWVASLSGRRGPALVGALLSPALAVTRGQAGGADGEAGNQKGAGADRSTDGQQDETGAASPTGRRRRRRCRCRCRFRCRIHSSGILLGAVDPLRKNHRGCGASRDLSPLLSSSSSPDNDGGSAGGGGGGGGGRGQSALVLFAEFEVTCSALLRPAPPCSALLRPAPPCSALLRPAPPCSALLRPAPPCSALLRPAPPCSALLRPAPPAPPCSRLCPAPPCSALPCSALLALLRLLLRPAPPCSALLRPAPPCSALLRPAPPCSCPLLRPAPPAPPCSALLRPAPPCFRPAPPCSALLRPAPPCSARSARLTAGKQQQQVRLAQPGMSAISSWASASTVHECRPSQRRFTSPKTLACESGHLAAFDSGRASLNAIGAAKNIVRLEVCRVQQLRQQVAACQHSVQSQDSAATPAGQSGLSTRPRAEPTAHPARTGKKSSAGPAAGSRAPASAGPRRWAAASA
uniref:EGF-like domain-containing protein n=1 Tax=Macrostomum lignano TaxID=282301 RepID=A0A1I8FC32_9PLAT